MDAWWQALNPLERFYWYFTILFSTMFVFYYILALFGIKEEFAPRDLDDFGKESFFDGDLRIMSIRNFIILMMVFGWSGVLMYGAGVGSPLIHLLSILIAVAAVLIVSFASFAVIRLTEKCDRKLKITIGHVGRVNIPIPPAKSGTGNIEMRIRGSFKGFKAMTDQPETLQVGALVRVVKVEGSVLVVRDD